LSAIGCRRFPLDETALLKTPQNAAQIAGIQPEFLAQIAGCCVFSARAHTARGTQSRRTDCAEALPARGQSAWYKTIETPDDFSRLIDRSLWTLLLSQPATTHAHSVNELTDLVKYPGANAISTPERTVFGTPSRPEMKA